MDATAIRDYFAPLQKVAGRAEHGQASGMVGRSGSNRSADREGGVARNGRKSSGRRLRSSPWIARAHPFYELTGGLPWWKAAIAAPKPESSKLAGFLTSASEVGGSSRPPYARSTTADFGVLLIVSPIRKYIGDSDYRRRPHRCDIRRPGRRASSRASPSPPVDWSRHPRPSCGPAPDRQSSRRRGFAFGKVVLHDRSLKIVLHYDTIPRLARLQVGHCLIGAAHGELLGDRPYAMTGAE